MTRKIRMGTSQNPGAELSGNVPAHTSRWRLMEGNRGRDPKRLLVLGCIKYGPKKSAGEIVQYLSSEGCMVATDVANVYRIMRQMVSADIIRKEHGRKISFVLTKHGEHYCPDMETFQRLMDASRTIIGIKEHGFIPKTEKPENAEKSLAEAASDALKRMEGVVSEEILAPLRRLINSIDNC
ncbi:MAG: hypothetical protein WC350_04575 [Candidatus Micrarchaeia archaeon]